MFSGLISHRAKIIAIDIAPLSDAGGAGAADTMGERGARITVAAPTAIADGVVHGDSIAINGVCLTVVAFDEQQIAFDVVPETIRRSTLGQLRPGDTVNLELSLRVGDRLGGHFVYGHVDATIAVREKYREGQGFRVSFACPEKYARYILEKGYVALDGVSLTVASVNAGVFSIAMIPETAAVTTLGQRGVGDEVNLELDPIARYAVAGAAAYIPNASDV